MEKHMSVVKIVVSSEEFTGAIYIMDDAPMYPVCEILAREELQVVSVEPIADPTDEQLRAALTGPRIVAA